MRSRLADTLLAVGIGALCIYGYDHPRVAGIAWFAALVLAIVLAELRYNVKRDRHWNRRRR